MEGCGFYEKMDGLCVKDGKLKIGVNTEMSDDKGELKRKVCCIKHTKVCGDRETMMITMKISFN